MTDGNVLALWLVGVGGVVCLFVLGEVILAIWATRQKQK